MRRSQPSVKRECTVLYRAVHCAIIAGMALTADRKPSRIEPDRYRLGEPGRTELQDFCEAMFGADQAKVIRAAVAAFIHAELDRNEGVRERYEALRRARRERNGTIPRLVKPKAEI
jgi:hypothetical protein